MGLKHITRSQVQAMVETSDEDKNGTIEFTEFCKLLDSVRGEAKRMEEVGASCAPPCLLGMSGT